MAKSKKTAKKRWPLTVNKMVDHITKNLADIVVNGGQNATILDRLVKLAGTTDKIAKSAKTIDEREAKRAERDAKKAERNAARKAKLEAQFEKLKVQLEKLES